MTARHRAMHCFERILLLIEQRETRVSSPEAKEELRNLRVHVETEKAIATKIIESGELVS